MKITIPKEKKKPRITIDFKKAFIYLPYNNMSIKGKAFYTIKNGFFVYDKTLKEALKMLNSKEYKKFSKGVIKKLKK